jgi:hypothetical protein
MTESAFATTHRILNERSDSFDLVRIIAKDSNISRDDRETLNQAANDYEDTQRSLVAVYQALIETQQKLIAVNEQLIEEKKKAIPGLQFNYSGPLVGAHYGH